jgi:hypothetical protein
MNRTQILHLNASRGRLVQNSLLNDETTKDFQALCVVEPYLFANPENGEPTILQDFRWQIYRPTTIREGVQARYSFRSAIWVNAKDKATQVPIDCPNTTAVILHTGDTHLLLISSYESRCEVSREESEEAQRARINSIREAREEAEKDSQEPLNLLVCADWNRHHVHWGGREALRQRTFEEEGEQIINFMQEAGLQSLLKAGTPTWEHLSLDRRSTIDLVLGSQGIQDNLIACQIHYIDHGSDYKAISTSYYSQQEAATKRKGKRLYGNADWPLIRAQIASQLCHTDSETTLRSNAQLDNKVGLLNRVTARTLEELVPRARESPYNKRWWTKELTELRAEYTTRRNRVTTLRRRGEGTARVGKLADSAKRTFHNAIDLQKSNHWKEFLDNPENVWKAAKYARRREGIAQIPDLTNGDETANSNKRKAEILMDTFYPTPPDPRGDEGRTQTRRDTIEWPELTLHEVKEAIFGSNSDKAPGPDEITFRVWKEIWPVVGPHLLQLYQSLLKTGHIPSEWKTDKIIVLRKPGKADYTKPKAFRPISLISTISKGLESVIARRLSYITERYKLLPENHFGARPNRSAEQALNLVIERIHHAWKNKKVLTLVSFDVKGAFNGIHAHILERRLRARGIPEQAVRWIRNFCTQRKAQISLGNYESEPTDIKYPGIPQGSPLSPLLYIFYNADLVERKINGKGGAMGFVDDFSAWVVGDNEKQTTKDIQDTIIPHATQWAEQSGAIFETDKTSLIYFTRRHKHDNSTPLRFGNDEILPQDNVKLLGVTLDKRLSMRPHITKVVNKATYACISFQSIKGLRPNQARQIYRSCVLPIVDYAASTWYGTGRKGQKELLQSLGKVQRLGARCILRAWKAVSLPVLEAEA